MSYTSAMAHTPAATSELVEKLRLKMIEAASSPSFAHHRWYVEYHLEIVERISLELHGLYPAADPMLVRVLAWLHDYGKTFGGTHTTALTLTEGRKRLEELGFGDDFVDRAIRYAELIDSKERTDLSTAPIEVQIVSSADGCAHLVGPFFPLWWHENPDRPIATLMADNRRKLHTDWTHKIVLPEARSAFAARYSLLLEQVGEFPEAFITVNPAD